MTKKYLFEPLQQIIIYFKWHKNWNLITLIQRHTCFVDISFICLYWCVYVVQSLEYCIMDFQRFQFFTAWGRTKRFCRHFTISNGLIPLHTYIKFIIYHIIECKDTQCNKMLILNTFVLRLWQALLVLPSIPCFGLMMLRWIGQVIFQTEIYSFV